MIFDFSQIRSHKPGDDNHFVPGGGFLQRLLRAAIAWEQLGSLVTTLPRDWLNMDDTGLQNYYRFQQFLPQNGFIPVNSFKTASFPIPFQGTFQGIYNHHETVFMGSLVVSFVSTWRAIARGQAIRKPWKQWGFNLPLLQLLNISWHQLKSRILSGGPKWRRSHSIVPDPLFQLFFLLSTLDTQNLWKEWREFGLPESISLQWPCVSSPFLHSSASGWIENAFHTFACCFFFFSHGFAEKEHMFSAPLKPMLLLIDMKMDETNMGETSLFRRPRRPASWASTGHHQVEQQQSADGQQGLGPSGDGFDCFFSWYSIPK